MCRFRQISPDGSECGCMKAVLLFTPGKVKREQLLSLTLHNYARNYLDTIFSSPYYFPNTLSLSVYFLLYYNHFNLNLTIEYVVLVIFGKRYSLQMDPNFLLN